MKQLLLAVVLVGVSSVSFAQTVAGRSAAGAQSFAAVQAWSPAFIGSPAALDVIKGAGLTNATVAPLLATLEEQGVTPRALAALAPEAKAARVAKALEDTRFLYRGGFSVAEYGHKLESADGLAAADAKYADEFKRYYDGRAYLDPKRRRQAEKAYAALVTRRVYDRALRETEKLAKDAPLPNTVVSAVPRFESAVREAKRGLGAVALVRAGSAASAVRGDAEAVEFVRRVGAEMRRVSAKIIKENGRHQAEIEYGKGLVQPLLNVVDGHRGPRVITAVFETLLASPGPQGSVSMRRANVEMMRPLSRFASLNLKRRAAAELASQARELETQNLGENGAALLAEIRSVLSGLQHQIATEEGLNGPVG